MARFRPYYRHPSHLLGESETTRMTLRPTGQLGLHVLRWSSAAVMMIALAPTPGRAQWLDARFPRRGQLQVEFGPGFATFDSRFRPDGSVQSTAEVYSALIGPGLVPELVALNDTIGNVFSRLGLPPPEKNPTLGRLHLDVLNERTRAPFTITWAVTDWLAVSGTVPIVNAAAFVGSGVDSATAGAGNTLFGGNPDAFFTDLDQAISQLESMVAADTLAPDRQAAAQALLDRARDVEAGLQAFHGLAYGPTDTGAAGVALHQLYDGLTAGFEGFGIMPPELTLAEPVDGDALAGFVSGSAFGTQPFRPRRVTGTKFGDLEVGLSLQPINTFPSPRNGSATVRVRARLDARYRFANATPRLASRLFDPGVGAGFPDAHLSSTVDLAFGRRFWLSAFGTFDLRREAEMAWLFTSPASPIQRGAFVAPAHWDPGDVWSAGIAPRFNLTPAITFSALFARTHHGRDRLTPVNALPTDAPFSPADQERGSRYTGRILGFGLRYASTEWDGTRRSGLPLEVELRYRLWVGADGGYAPRLRVWEVGARWYPSLYH